MYSNTENRRIIFCVNSHDLPPKFQDVSVLTYKSYAPVLTLSFRRNLAQLDAKLERVFIINNKVAIKNNICVKGELTTCGLRMLENFRPPYNATVIDKLAAAEPLRSEELELSSDYDGSTRSKAAERGLAAFKPTYGSVSRYGLITAAPSLEQITPIGKTVCDVAELYGVICGADERDATTLKRDYPDFTATIGNGVDKLKIGVLADAQCAALQSAGTAIASVELPTAEYALATHAIITCAEMFSNLARQDGVKFGYRSEKSDSLTELYENSRAEGFGAETKKQIITGAIVLSKDNRHLYYDRAIRARAKLCAELNVAFDKCDIIITPQNGEWAVIPHLTGCPALAIGDIQLIGAKFSEELLFRAARAIEIAGDYR